MDTGTLRFGNEARPGILSRFIGFLAGVFF